MNTKQKNIYRVILYIAGMFWFSSCCETVVCDPWRAAEITAIDLTQDELKFIYVKKFKSKSNLIIAIDSTVLYSRSDYTVTVSNSAISSLKFYGNGITPRFPIEVGYEYEILFPIPAATNGLISKRITEIIEAQLDERFCFTGFAKNVCYNRLVSLKVDGVPTNRFTLRK